jgi:hypothetical protein
MSANLDVSLESERDYIIQKSFGRNISRRETSRLFEGINDKPIIMFLMESALSSSEETYQIIQSLRCAKSSWSGPDDQDINMLILQMKVRQTFKMKVVPES